MSSCLRQTAPQVVSAEEKSNVVKKEDEVTVGGRKDVLHGMFVRSPNIFLTHAVTKSSMRVSDVTTSKAGGKQKLRATLDSVWQKKNKTTGSLFEVGMESPDTNLQKKIIELGGFGPSLAHVWAEKTLLNTLPGIFCHYYLDYVQNMSIQQQMDSIMPTFKVRMLRNNDYHYCYGRSRKNKCISTTYLCILWKPTRNKNKIGLYSPSKLP